MNSHPRKLSLAEWDDRYCELIRARLPQPPYVTSPGAPLPALEMLIAEMLAIHFCSDREETIAVLDALLAKAAARVRLGQFVVPEVC